MMSEEVAALDGRLGAFLEALLGFLGRADRRRWARLYVAGLLLEGARKSVQPLAARLGLAGDATQSLAAVRFHGPLVKRVAPSRDGGRRRPALATAPRLDPRP